MHQYCKMRQRSANAPNANSADKAPSTFEKAYISLPIRPNIFSFTKLRSLCTAISELFSCLTNDLHAIYSELGNFGIGEDIGY